MKKVFLILCLTQISYASEHKTTVYPTVLDNQNFAMTLNGYLLVKGIEKWILKLVPKSPVKKDGTMVLMQDPETKAVFAVKRVK